MARLSNISTVRVGEESVTLRTVNQGYGGAWTAVLLDRDDVPVPLDNVAIAALAEFATCTLKITGIKTTDPTAEASNFVIQEDLEAVDLTVTKDPDQTANPGRFEIAIPANIYPGDIPPDITEKVPVAIGYVIYEREGSRRVGRFLLAFRRGVSS